MDTRQLAAFCAVVERRSFSQAAERLGVTQPAVSLQIRTLEKRLGTQLLDRSGRRVEPTEAGRRLYRGAQRMLALEDQLVAEVGASGEGALAGDLVLGASTGPAAIAVPVVLVRVPARESRRPRLPDGLGHPFRRRARRSARTGARHRRRSASASRCPLRALLLGPGHPRVSRRAPVREPDREPRRAARGDPDPHAGGRRRPADRRGRAPATGRQAPRPRRPARARPAGVGAAGRWRQGTE